MIVSWFPRKNAPCFCTHTSFLFWALMNCRSLMKICWMGNYRIFFSLPLILTRDRIFSTLFFSLDAMIVDQKSCSGKILTVLIDHWNKIHCRTIPDDLLIFVCFLRVLFVLCITKNYRCSCTHTYSYEKIQYTFNVLFSVKM